MKKYNFDQCRLIKMRHRLVVFSLDGDAKTSLFLFLSQCKFFLEEQELPELNVHGVDFEFELKKETPEQVYIMLRLYSLGASSKLLG